MSQLFRSSFFFRN